MQSNPTNLLVCKLNANSQVFRRQALRIGSLLSQIGAPQPCLFVLLIPRLACIHHRHSHAQGFHWWSCQMMPCSDNFRNKTRRRAVTSVSGLNILSDTQHTWRQRQCGGVDALQRTGA